MTNLSDLLYESTIFNETTLDDTPTSDATYAYILQKSMEYLVFNHVISLFTCAENRLIM